MNNLIAIVDVNDKVIGFDDKLEVHRKGLLHRAFSIFVFNCKGEMLLQRRALDKYHSAGLWTNTCCSHLPKGIEMEPYVHQRLAEEMGFDCDLRFVKTFHYKIDFQDGMIENEIDHIFLGTCDAIPKPNPHEVCQWRWVALEDVCSDVKVNPDVYTYWFRFIIENHLDAIKKLS
ncbi:MAG: isopentenyl-diphosphate Delta-isomerase [Bacteroidales bacterium]|nr:MAG: isopentenyl-diphosphate Delta-isomerase [Bacteroidales bacterium]